MIHYPGTIGIKTITPQIMVRSQEITNFSVIWEEKLTPI